MSKSSHQQAFNSCNRAAKLDSKFSEAYYLRARTNKYLGRYKQSLKDYDTASALLLKQGYIKEAEEVGRTKESDIYFHELKKRNLLKQK